MDFQTDLFSQDHNEPVKSPSTHQLVKQLKAAGEDFEWYPTTPSQLAVVAEHMTQLFTILRTPQKSHVAAGTCRWDSRCQG